MTRQIDNFEIVGIIKSLVAQYPDLRFIQLLQLVDIATKEDKFYEESDVTLERLKRKVKELKH